MDYTSHVGEGLPDTLTKEVKKELVEVLVLNSSKPGGRLRLIYTKVCVHISKRNIGKTI